MRLLAAKSLRQTQANPRVPTPAGRVEREAFTALHHERLKQLTAVEDRLTFGRLDLAGGQAQYIGRIGLSDQDQTQLLIDWRAPAAAPFYQATAALPGLVIRRRQLGLKGRRVTSINDELLDPDRFHDSGMRTVTGDGALMSALTAHRTGQMRDIVATLQAEQDQVVRAPLSGVLVVQGGPGTGKTAVALHRAAYLLYTHRDRIAGSGVLVVGPTPVFLKYISQVLPSLGESGVVLKATGQLFPGLDTTATDPAPAARLKGDLRMIELIRRAVRHYQRTPAAPVSLLVDGDRIELTPRVAAEARNRARQAGKPHNEARSTFVRHLLDDLARQLAAVRRLPEDEEHAELVAELVDEPAVRREVNLCWLPLSPHWLLNRLLTNSEFLARCGQQLLNPAERQSLLRTPGPDGQHAWSVDDVPLLDEIAELVGPDIAVMQPAQSAQQQAARARAEAIDFAQRVLRETEAAGLTQGMVSAEQLADRFAESGPMLDLADRASSDRTWIFGHVVVDEAQELSPMQWRLLLRRVPTGSMTVVGDIAQSSSPSSARSWAGALDEVTSGRWRLAELRINYRTPGQVMRLASGLLTAHGLDSGTVTSAREGNWAPRWVQLAGDEEKLVAAACLDELVRARAEVGGGRQAVICPSPQAAALAETLTTLLADHPEGAQILPDLSVLTPAQAKGLEFDTVLVVDPMGVLTQHERGVNDLYVALTRPTQQLVICHYGQLPAGLDTPPAD